MQKHAFALILAVLMTACIVLAPGCDQYPPGPAQASGTASGYGTQTAYPQQRTYQPLYPPRSNWKDFAPGTITYDFHYAATAPTLEVAEQRWQMYLSRHSQIEDGFSKNYYIAARFELMRVYYLQGRGDKADAILRGFDLSTTELAR